MFHKLGTTWFSSPLKTTRKKAFFAALFGTLLVLLSNSANAFERQWHAGANVGYASLVNGQGATSHGFGAGLHLTYGVSDTINALVLADFSFHPDATDGGKKVPQTLLAGGSAGFAYVFDILQWVPYLGATAGAYWAESPSGSGARLALQLPFGLDYQISRSFAVGVAGEYKLLFLDVSGVAQRINVYLRAEYIWGY